LKHPQNVVLISFCILGEAHAYIYIPRKPQLMLQPAALVGERERANNKRTAGTINEALVFV
jgi:hypothetical protein